MTGSLVSSAMLTESSNPTIAKKASEVAAVTAMKAFLSSAVSKATTPREVDVATAGECPQPDQNHQQQTGDLDDGQEDVELDAFADATQIHRGERRHEEQRQSRRHRLCPSPKSNPLKRFAANVRDAVDAEVMPEHITTNAIRNVTN